MARSRESNLSIEARNATVVELSRATARESLAILNEASRSDTFLGRKTQEPFPAEKKTDGVGESPERAPTHRRTVLRPA